MSSSVNQVNYDALTQIAKQLHSESEEHAQLNAQTRQRMEALQGGWQGDAAKAFFNEMNGTVLPASQRVVGALQAGESVLNQIMQIIQQADEETASYFKLADIKSIDSLTDVMTQIKNFGIQTAKRLETLTTWNLMSFDEKKKWLEDRYKELCQKQGMPPVDFKVEDLPDPFLGDYKGVFDFHNMTVDIDNVKWIDPFDSLGTIGHETQHQYQWYLIQNPDKRPVNISLEQIQIWKDNFYNYKSGTDNFELYSKQPIEVDARQAEDRFVADFLSDGLEVR